MISEPNNPRDRFARPLRDLRLSVTDRCNFRCTYCMPKEVFGHAHPFLPKSQILTFEELTRLTRIFVGLGVEKVRLTGGEPCLRRDLPTLVAQLRNIEGLADLTLTTNGSTLVDHAVPLRAAGLSRITVSLDALDDAIFRAMNDVEFPVHRVLRGIEAAQAAGFSPIKLNVVVRRGVNESEVLPIARRFAGPEFIVRFIEYMDVGNSNGWRLDEVVSANEIAALLDAEHSLNPLPANYEGEVAGRYRTSAGGEVGIISSVTKPFCRNCTRARLSADGRLFTCLFSGQGHDLRTPLRNCASDEHLATIIRDLWFIRDDRYSELRTSGTAPHEKVEMSAIGG